MARQTLPELFRAARRDPSAAVLEGLHPWKHARRFGAEVGREVTPDRRALERLTRALAPELEDRIADVEEIPRELFSRLAPTPPPTGILAIARRPTVDLDVLLAAPGPEPLVLIEHPQRLGNLGAAVRAAAAAGAAGVLVSGPLDPWHPDALRSSAGLHFAVAVTSVGGVPTTDRPSIAIDPEGAPLVPGAIPRRALLLFGTERAGLAPATLERADHRLAIPMRLGVSSLNLASAVAVAVYAWRWSLQGPGEGPGIVEER